MPKLMMNKAGESDSPIVPTKQANEARKLAEEFVEERGLTKGNAIQQNTYRTQGRNSTVPNELGRIRQIAKRSKDIKFTALFHHINQLRLRAAFFNIKKNAAPGIDGKIWRDYETNLEVNIKVLHQKVQQGGYHAKPSRRVYIPKPNGKQRVLGIAALEDKILQKATVEILNAIYEQDFLGFSYGYRPKRNQHRALDALAVGIRSRKINWILNADIGNFFDKINHKWMMKFIGHRIADKRVLHLIQKWLKAGVIEKGKWKPSEEGTSQGSTISPLFSNIYLHYALDMWVQQWRTRHAKGDVIIVRWADDFNIGFQYEYDAKRFQDELKERLNKFSLELSLEKTQLIRFGRFAKTNCHLDGERKPKTFDFLGFTHICRTTGKGIFVVHRKSISKRLTSKLKEVKLELRKRMHESIEKQGNWLCSIVRGYFAYHAVPLNAPALGIFRTQIARMWYKSLRRRSQKTRLTWDKMTKISDRWLPKLKILHPYPEARYRRLTQGRSPVR